jgi:uncharacterized protein DUF1592/uncharacterized protein DUF1588/uncharacterized protein DUF1587/uncharacterized protein DUF1595/predicted xylan-binding protein with Ca-dependent carbohydrate-binding module/uncharacterized protein DUF1585/cytochrome c
MGFPWLALLPPVQGPESGLETLVQAHCVECHAGEKPKAELDLGALVAVMAAPGASAAGERRATFERVREVLRAGEMPPPREPRPPAERVAAALAWLEGELGPAPELPRLRRLNRVEYERAVRDLVGVAYPARALFPADDVGARFDNDAAGAGASDLQVERWVEAAEVAAARALPLEGELETHTLAPSELALEGGASPQLASVSLYSAGRVYTTRTVARTSRYRLELTGWGDLAGDEPPRMALEVDGREVGREAFTVELPERQTLAVTLEVEAGEHEFGARFLNDHYAPDHPDPGERDRNAHVASLALVGPLDPAPETPFIRFVDDELGRGGVAGALSALGLRVWRRPLEPEELARLLSFTSDDVPAHTRIRTGLVALLASPNFLYKVERAEPSPAQRQFELASRLAFFLWASAPDEELLARASRGELERPDVREAEVSRMLRDARSSSLAEEFAAQWLGWRALTLRVARTQRVKATSSRGRLPEEYLALLDSMRQESEAFFDAMLREERPLSEFLEADFAFVDERLAQLYGIEGVTGEGVRRVPVPDGLRGGLRGGLLGQAALLTVTSNPTRTSPVKRGKWVLETLLGERVPPPPPGVGVLAEPGKDSAPRSLRERLAEHRADPDCASCHAALDPLGFALEGFDALGRARTHDGELPVDTRGELADGTVLAGLQDLRRHLLASGRFPRAMADALFVYALGREPDEADGRELASALAALSPEKLTLAGVIAAVCRTSAFLPDPKR